MSPRRTVLFVVQNETHAMNAAVLGRQLLSSGRWRIRVLCLDSVMHLDTRRFVPPEFLLPMNLSATQSFYRMNAWSRISWLVKHRSQLTEIVQGIDLLVVGSDGAIQRLLARAAAKEGAKVVMLLDGLIYPWSDSPVDTARRVLKRFAASFSAVFGLDYLVPSLLGHSKLDLILVMDDLVRKELVRQGVKAPVRTVLLPRHEALAKEVQCAREALQGLNGVAPGLRVLYASSAFGWHSLAELAEAQARDIRDLIAFASRNPSVSIRLRIHPRENHTDYDELERPENVMLTDVATPLHEDLAWATMIATGRSSLAYEAGLAGLSCYISMRYFPDLDPASYLANAQHVIVVESFDDLLASTEGRDGAPSQSCELPRVAEILQGLR